MEMAEIIYVKDANGNLVQTTIKDLREDRLKKLEEENRKLEEDVAWYEKEEDRLREENKKLKELKCIPTNLEKAIRIDKENERLEEENKKLKEKIKRLEFDVDAWHQLKLLLEGEIEKLKSDLDECECSFGFESDEVGFWKREYKRLKKWIKDHCRGYGNLFPEDEMKRQRKKADKKRK